MQELSTSGDPNEVMYQIFLDLSKIMYSPYGSFDLSTEVTGTFILNNQQQISECVQLLVDGKPQQPQPEMLARMSLRTQKILELPVTYKLAGITIDVKAGGNVNFEPTYLE
ncbi:hypothetical protein HGA91_00145 [candidate division WWE3 bacterium]|nr:hypothetical protein [candidate division WWE3 bacterium]